ncbi:hypothetical protein [Allonocardiopsis opalescens]|uniref:LemA protein n=1 Tax=Allonocardiopsis opalescens TaxID=1144618 RepID=A0A2T0PX09_9ACTN|nr:hypothetical protein [Allonocardiopsis opalescens]PRX96061.1 hypothetical protein CLV72_10865 [Allonocardiopsis opalescens]
MEVFHALLGDLAIVVSVLGLFAFYISWRAGRLDRLHTRVETARAALDAALVRRSAVVLELASSGRLDPATAVLLAEAAQDARRADEPDARELAESHLSGVLRAVVEQDGFHQELTGRPGGPELYTELRMAAKQVYLARRFYNDAVALTRLARRKRLVRLLRLSGRAELPDFFEIDDEPPKMAA